MNYYTVLFHCNFSLSVVPLPDCRAILVFSRTFFRLAETGTRAGIQSKRVSHVSQWLTYPTEKEVAHKHPKGKSHQGDLTQTTCASRMRQQARLQVNGGLHQNTWSCRSDTLVLVVLALPTLTKNMTTSAKSYSWH
eukprot:1973553-Amphidinium_carterae.1